MSARPQIQHRAVYAQMQYLQRVRSIAANFAAYEHRKAAWRAANPSASPAQYDQAMNRIARECGV